MWICHVSAFRGSAAVNRIGRMAVMTNEPQITLVLDNGWKLSYKTVDGIKTVFPKMVAIVEAALSNLLPIYDERLSQKERR